MSIFDLFDALDGDAGQIQYPAKPRPVLKVPPARNRRPPQTTTPATPATPATTTAPPAPATRPKAQTAPEVVTTSPSSPKKPFSISLPDGASIFRSTLGEENVKAFAALFSIITYIETTNKRPTTHMVNVLQRSLPGAKLFTTFIGVAAPRLMVLDEFCKGKKPALLWDVLREIGDALKNSAAIQRDPLLDTKGLNFLTDIGVWLRAAPTEKAREPSFKRLQMNISALGDPELTREFSALGTSIDDTLKRLTADIQMQGSYIKEMQKLVHELVGRTDMRFTGPEMKELTNDPARKPQYERWLECNRSAKAISDRVLVSVLRASGQEYLEFNSVRDMLTRSGLALVYLPTGFVGNIGLYRGKPALFTTGGVPIERMPRWSSRIHMNPKYDPETDTGEYVFKIEDDNIETNPVYYTNTMKSSNRSARFSKIMSAITIIDTMKAKWEKDIRDHDPNSLIFMCAMMVHLVSEIQARIGDPKNNVKGEPTYGLSTLQGRHVKKNGNTYSFHYPGKKNVEQDHDFIVNVADPVERAIGARFDQLMKMHGPEDYLMTYNDTAPRRVAAKDVNDYMRSIGFNITIHKLRHVRGTALALRLIEETRAQQNFVTQRDAELFYKDEIGLAVGDILGHKKTVKHDDGTVTKETRAETCIAAYIAPEVSAEFFTDRGFRVPEFVQRLLR